jgi:hypothetical protein
LCRIFLQMPSVQLRAAHLGIREAFSWTPL